MVLNVDQTDRKEAGENLLDDSYEVIQMQTDSVGQLLPPILYEDSNDFKASIYFPLFCVGILGGKGEVIMCPKGLC